MTKRRQDLLQALTQIQNHPAHSHHDILTITGYGMTNAQLERHIETNMEQIARWSDRGLVRSGQDAGLDEADRTARKSLGTPEHGREF